MLALNVFSNLSHTDVSQHLLPRCLDSFFACFDRDTIGTMRLFLHPRPFAMTLPAYRAMLQRTQLAGCEVVLTENLADGYVRSITTVDADYAFQLEHDWLFNKPLIHHTLGDICAALRASGEDYIRFNKRSTKLQPGSRFDGVIEETTLAPGFVACRTNCRSNNPHVIDTRAYREKYVVHIDTKRGGSKGIEDNLTDILQNGLIYGPEGYPATVGHLDGRSQTKGINKVAPPWLRKYEFGYRYGVALLGAKRRFGMVRKALRLPV